MAVKKRKRDPKARKRGSESTQGKAKATEGRRGKAPSVKRFETRFSPRTTPATVLTYGVMMVGAAVLGAGVVGRFLMNPVHQYGAHLVMGGAAGLALLLLFGPTLPDAVRVGDGGVALERGSDPPTRMAWYELETIEVSDGRLNLTGAQKEIGIDLAAHPSAAHRAVKQAARRLGADFELDAEGEQEMPDDPGDKGKKLAYEAPQVAGKRCAKSGQKLDYERDARVCGTCFAIYHRSAIPKTCVICSAKL